MDSASMTNIEKTRIVTAKLYKADLKHITLSGISKLSAKANLTMLERMLIFKAICATREYYDK